MANYKLIGKDFTPPDLVAKVTGAAKYAEDFRADGMLFVRGDGWIAVIEIKDRSEKSNLMDGKKYAEYVKKLESSE